MSFSIGDIYILNILQRNHYYHFSDLPLIINDRSFLKAKFVHLIGLYNELSK